MTYKVNSNSIEEVKKLIVGNKIKELSITNINGEYFINYKYEENLKEISGEKIAQILTAINEFSTALLLNKVISFSLEYKYGERVLINSSFAEDFNESSVIDQMNILKNNLDSALSLARAMEMDNAIIENVFKKATGKNNRARYVKINVIEALQEICNRLN